MFTDSTGEDLTNIYVTDEWLYEQYAGNALWTGGLNAEGQLGDNTMPTAHNTSYVLAVGNAPTWKQVACGYKHTAAVKTDGTLWTWGYNFQGQLGNNASANIGSPVQTASATADWKQVAAGYQHTAAIKTDGTLWLWGYNNYGQLANNSVTMKSSPVQVYGGGTNWKQVACGKFHTAAIKTDGTLWTCGYNTTGCLGDNTIVSKSSIVQVTGGGTNWKQVACGGSTTVAIKTDGTLWSFGSNPGDGTTTIKSSPIQTIAGGSNWKQVSVAKSVTAAIKTDGTLWTWGQDVYGTVGQGGVIGVASPTSSPAQVYGGGTNWKRVDAGCFSTIIAIKTDSTAWGWGYNGWGQLGGGSGSYSVPQQIPLSGAGSYNYKQGATGFYHAALISTDAIK